MAISRTASLIVVLGLVVSAYGATPPKERAVQLVKIAADMVAKDGREAGLAKLSKSESPTVEGELYVFAYDLQGVIVAHPKNSKLVGKNMLEVPDVDGKLFRKEIVEVARTKGTGWVDYKYKNPETGAVEEKTTWVRKVGDVILCCGVYR